VDVEINLLLAAILQKLFKSIRAEKEILIKEARIKIQKQEIDLQKTHRKTLSPNKCRGFFCEYIKCDFIFCPFRDIDASLYKYYCRINFMPTI